jgi:hypothetical protein
MYRDLDVCGECATLYRLAAARAHARRWKALARLLWLDREHVKTCGYALCPPPRSPKSGEGEP